MGLRFEKLDFSLTVRFSEINFWDYNDFENGLPTQSGTYRFTTLELVATLAYGWNGFLLHMQGGMVSGYSSDFKDATGDAWGNLHLNIGFAFVNKMEDCPLVPPISLIKEPDNSRFPPPPAVLQVRQSTGTICLSDEGEFDGDVINASLNGSYVFNDVILRKRPICFEVNMQPNSENLLQIQAISNGELCPNTLKLTIKNGRKSSSFYLLTEAGKTESMRLRLE